MKHFAVETLGETNPHVVEVVIQAAVRSGYSFSHIEVLDQTRIGSIVFLRFRVNVDPTALLAVLQSEGRGTISPDREVRLKSKTGKVPFTQLFAAPREQKVYRGPGDPHWKRQFEIQPNA
jgi:hypothetical protein